MTPEGLLIGKGETEACLLPGMANRHGLITGATGTGKTVTLQTLAEQFSRIGVPVFLADVKGDLTGLSQPGNDANPKIAERRREMGLDTQPLEGCPVVLWDVFGEQGHPMRATVSEMGPLLIGRILGLNDTQEGVLAIAFRLADEHGLPLLDLKDLRAIVQYVGDNAKAIKTQYGNVSPASVGAIQRGLLTLEQQGGDRLFGEPALRLPDLMRTDARGRGVVNILAADKLLHAPKVYSTFLLWLLAELFEELPEVGDPPQPKLAFFFDEAHLLFADSPKALLDRVEQVVRLIRSKGVGVYFVTQNPIDVPPIVLGQLGNRVQHALRAFTPRDRKAVKAAAETFRPNPKLDTEAVISELGVGEALVSFLDARGAPNVVERVRIAPPSSQVGPITPEQRRAILAQSGLGGRYDRAIDRDSAYEMLQRRASEAAEAEVETKDRRAERDRRERELDQEIDRLDPGPRPRARPAPAPRTDDVFTSFAKSAARSVGTSLGRTFSRGILDVLGLGTKRSRRKR